METISAHIGVLPEVGVAVDRVDTGPHRSSLGHLVPPNLSVLGQHTSSGADGREQPHALLNAALEVLQRLEVFSVGVKSARHFNKLL